MKHKDSKSWILLKWFAKKVFYNNDLTWAAILEYKIYTYRKSFFENHVKLHLSISQLFWANHLSKKVASFCVYSCHHECESGETADAKDNNVFFKRILRRIDVIPLCNNSSEVCGRSLSSTPQFSACWVRAGEEKKIKGWMDVHLLTLNCRNTH